MKTPALILCLGFLMLTTILPAQQNSDIRNMSRKEIKALSYVQLLELSLEDLIYVSDKMGISIDDLLEDPTTVSSKTAMGTRETPGIVSILTKTDIENSGAQDLSDLLRTIPGIYFGMDVDGVSGIFMRGNWGHEGKVLFLLDDMELNENMYSVTQIFNHIPASQISRIEVVRGPGSALYGGYAELGVVKITTHQGHDLNATQISAVGGTFGSGVNRNGFGFKTGAKHGNSTYSLMGSWNRQDASKGDFIDFYNDVYELQDGWLNSRNTFLNLKYSWKQLETQFVYDDFSIVPTGYEDQNPNRFRNYLSMARYSIDAGKNIRITPGVFYKSQTPYWFENLDEETFWFYKRTAHQFTGSVDMEWNAFPQFQVIAGSGYRYDHAQISEAEQESVGEQFYNDEFSIHHQNIFAYAQANYSSWLGNIFAGSRLENHSVTGVNIAPRLGYTRVFNKFNLKYLYSHAFRSPSIENVNINPDIKIERTLVNELALGYRFNNHYYASVNLYDIVIKDPILYGYDYENDEENYFNDLQTGSNGFEFEMKSMYTRWNAGISYSYYDASRHNKSEVYSVITPSGHMARMMKGVPTHMVHFNASVRILRDTWLSPKFSWYSAQYGFINSAQVQEKADPYLLADINLMMRNLFVRHLNVGISLRNIFNQSYGYIQPIGIAGYAEKPMPGRPLEALLNVSYRIDH
jgi:outer membrane cobalamin receptor